MFFFFFFKQKTAYEIYQCDWSSDVCSSDLVLQAGSFSEFTDADRRRATLALQGIESRIQRVTIDDKTYHRVRIGPIDDLDQLNVLRARLRAANIDVLRIRLGD